MIKFLRVLFALLVVGITIAACAPAPTPAPTAAPPTTAAPASTVAPAPTTAPAAKKTQIKLGFVADITGVGYVFAQSQLAGLRIALDDLNAKGGILGLPVDFVVRDAQLKADVGATLARQMVLEDKVDFLLGPTSSSVALAVSEVAKENKVIIAFHTSNTVELTTNKGHPYLFQVVPNTSIEGRAAAQFAAKLGYKKWASIGPDYAFGRDEFNAWKPRLLKVIPGGTVSTEQWPALAERNLSPFITAIQSSSPEATYGNLWGDQLVTFVQQAAPLGFFKTPYMGLYDTDFMKSIGGDLPDGLPGYARAPFYAYNNPQMDDFVKKHLALTKQYPSDWAIMMYDSILVLKAASEKAGSTNGDAVAKALEDLTIKSLRGDLTIRACDHMANVGEWTGVSGKDPKYPFSILKNASYVKAEDVWNTCEEVQSARQTGKPVY